MQLPTSRGPLSQYVLSSLREPEPASPAPPLRQGPVALDADCQIALWVLYELHYRGFDDEAGDHEWDPELLRLRRAVEDRFEQDLRAATETVVAGVDLDSDLAEELLSLVARDSGPSVAAFLHRHAERQHVLDYLSERSLQQLKESDPQSFLLARLDGPAKVALAEIQYDEYGGGRPDRLHQLLYAQAMAGAGLDPSYGALVESVSAEALAGANVMSMFALNRRLRGAAAGHFAALEASSSVPSRKVAAGIDRLGFAPEVAEYFLEHVEADAVHEQVAARDVCAGMAGSNRMMRRDVIFGAACVLHLDALFAQMLLAKWHVADELQAVAS